MPVQESNYKRILFRVALLSMLCDGEIDSREISEIKWLDIKSNYFKGLDLHKELELLRTDLANRDKQLIEDLLHEMEGAALSSSQELTLLEVALKTIYADRKAKPNEIRFLQVLRSGLHLDNETLLRKFEFASFLADKDYTNSIVKSECCDCFMKDFVLPDLMHLPVCI